MCFMSTCGLENRRHTLNQSDMKFKPRGNVGQCPITDTDGDLFNCIFLHFKRLACFYFGSFASGAFIFYLIFFKDRSTINSLIDPPIKLCNILPSVQVNCQSMFSPLLTMLATTDSLAFPHGNHVK